MLGAERSLASFAGRRILAIRAGALGDTILSLPSLRALRKLVGTEGELDFAGTEPAATLVQGGGLASRVFSIERAPFRTLFQESADVSFLRPYALVVAWSSAPLLERKLAPLGIPLLQSSPEPPPGTHASDHLYRSLAPLSIVPPAPPPELDLDPESEETAREFLGRSGLDPLDFAAIHPSSGSPRKNWPSENFAELFRHLDGGGRRVLWIEGEADRDVVGPLVREAQSPVARDLPLKTLAGVLALAAGFVGNDSGVTHLAAAVGTPTIALFGPTDPSIWAPRGRWVRVVSHASPPESVWAIARLLFRNH
jgi:ADP-heptose:LPS heptosyltransferase